MARKAKTLLRALTIAVFVSMGAAAPLAALGTPSGGTSGESGESGGESAGETSAEQKSGGQEADPQAEEAAELRRSMVEQQIEKRGVDDSLVLEAMRSVPRHRFVPSGTMRKAYADQPRPIGHGQTISQPYIVAYMTEMLQLEPGEKVLEIGTGSGYQAAVLAEITDRVWSIEIIEDLADTAKQRLRQLGYQEVRTRQGDGYYGWESAAPFDGIIVTAAAGHIPPPLIDQLTSDGRMIIPIGGTYEVQSLMLVEKSEDGEVTTERLMPVRFVPMTGAAQD